MEWRLYHQPTGPGGKPSQVAHRLRRYARFRALDAIEFGTCVDKPGFNLFVIRCNGIGL